MESRQQVGEAAATPPRAYRRPGRCLLALAAPLLLAAGLAVAPIGAPAGGAVLQCGATVTSSTMLRANLTCSGYGGPWALRVVGQGVTLNLGGHTVSGQYPHDALYLTGTRITVEDGTIHRATSDIFATSARGDVFQNLAVQTAGYGINVTTATFMSVSFDRFFTMETAVDFAHGYGTTIADNTFQDAGSGVDVDSYTSGLTIRGNGMTQVCNGIYVGFAETGTSISSNRMTGRRCGDGIYIANGFGVSVTTNQSRDFFDGLDVRYVTGTIDNNTFDTNGDGAYCGGLDSATFRNDVFNGNVDGMYLYDPAHVSIIGSTADNNYDGIDIENNYYYSSSHPGASVTRTTAAGNTHYGFFAAHPVPGSRNVTRDNGLAAFNVTV